MRLGARLVLWRGYGGRGLCIRWGVVDGAF